MRNTGCGSIVQALTTACRVVSIKDENEHDAIVAVERTTDGDDKYLIEEEEIPWPANLYPGCLHMGFYRKGLHHWVPIIRYK